MPPPSSSAKRGEERAETASRGGDGVFVGANALILRRGSVARAARTVNGKFSRRGKSRHGGLFVAASGVSPSSSSRNSRRSGRKAALASTHASSFYFSSSERAGRRTERLLRRGRSGDGVSAASTAFLRLRRRFGGFDSASAALFVCRSERRSERCVFVRVGVNGEVSGVFSSSSSVKEDEERAEK